MPKEGSDELEVEFVKADKELLEAQKRRLEARKSLIKALSYEGLWEFLDLSPNYLTQLKRRTR